MRFIRWSSISNKILILPVIMVISLGTVFWLNLRAFNKQLSVQREFHEIVLERKTLVNEKILLVKGVESDLQRIAVIRFMNMPEKEIQPIHENLSLGLNRLKLKYGHMLGKWSLDANEKEILLKIRTPLETFTLQARQAIDVASKNPSLGVFLIRSAAKPFDMLRRLLTELEKYQNQKIAQIETRTRKTLDAAKITTAALSLATGLAAIILTILIGVRWISRPIRSMTDVMERLAEGDLSIEVDHLKKRDEIGSMAHAVEVFRKNAIEKNTAVEALKTSETNYRSIFDTANDAIFIHEVTTGRILAVNQKMLEMYGYTLDEARRVDFAALSEGTPPYSQQDALTWIAKAAEGEPQVFEWKAKTKAGDIFWVEVNLKLSTIGNQERLLTIARDITQRKKDQLEHEKLQTQLMQSQKMESVGRLAGGVAHDFNNMLSVIIGHAELVMDQLDPEVPVQENLKEIHRAAQHSADLTRQLLAFARKQTAAPRVLDLNKTIAGMLKMLRRLIGEDIGLAWMPGMDLWPVKIDPAQIDQIMANLCVNARDAIAGVGKITIETQNVTLDEDYCADHAGFIPGAFAMLAVSDDGCGMGAETRKNLFEPFFTTKGVGEGSGLGLATIYGIVKQNAGFINVYSEPGHGATFKIYLPRSHDTVEAKRHPAAESVEKGTETVLLVEDEESILQMGKTMLERFGYTVLAANTPKEALVLAERHKEPIHLLVTDVVMPGMDGKVLKDHIEIVHPDIRVLFMSGYTANVIMHRGILESDVHFLPKPFSINSLAAKVREVLDEADSAD